MQGPYANGTSVEADLDEAACTGLMHALNRYLQLLEPCQHSCMCRYAKQLVPESHLIWGSYISREHQQVAVYCLTLEPHNVRHPHDK